MMVSDNGLALIRKYEGLVTKAYPDPATGNEPWTIGYGHTHGVKKGDTCSVEQANQWLTQDATEASIQVLKAVMVPLTQNQLDALTSFVYNIGITKFMPSTLLKLLNNGKYQEAANELPKWIGKNLPGLVKRRQEEKTLFLKE